MAKVQTYKNNLGGFRKWCKDHPWNSLYQDEKEYNLIGGYKLEQLYVEFSLNENSDKSLSAYCAVRKYVESENTFKTVYKEDIPKVQLEEIEKKYDRFAKRNRVAFACEII